MSQKVQSLMVEIDGNLENLRRALREGGVELDTFAKKSDRTGKTSSTAADATASRQANAARAIAMTTETIARQGQVSGETAKQLVAQGSNMAFMFGPTGAIVGAIGIATLAIVAMFNRTKREMQETIDKAREAQNQFSEMDPVGQARALNQLVSGRRSDRAVLSTAQIMERPEEQRDELFRQRGINRLRTDEARLLQEARDAASHAPDYVRSRARVAELEAVRAALATLNEELTRNTKELSANAGAEAVRNVEGMRRAAQTKAEAEAAKEREKVEREFERAVAESARAIAAFDKEATDFGAAFDQTVLRDLGSNVDRVAASFDRLIEQGTRVAGASDPRVIQLKQMKTAAVEAARAAEELERVQARKGKVAGLERKAETVLKEGSRSAAEIAREIQQAVDGALQLAAAFGAIDASATSLLRSIAQIAGNLPAMQKALRSGSGVGIISAALPIAGALASLIGSDPAEEARREELRRNTEAIRELTKKAGLLGIGVTGADAASAQVLLQDFLSRVGGGQIVAGGRTYSASDQATIAAERLGILDELQEVAQRYGITLNRNIASFEQLAIALSDTITKLGEFGTDLDSAMQQANAEARIFGITDPLAKLKLTQGAFAGRSPVFDQLTAGLDLSAAEGRERARQNAQELFNVLKAGGDTLTPEQLGGLSGQELLDAILQLVDGLDAIDGAQVSPGSSLAGVSGFRGLTEAAGERMADYLRGILSQGDEHLAVLRAQLAELTRIAQTPFTLPVIPGVTVPATATAGTGAFAAGAVTVSIGDIVIEVNGAGATDPAALSLLVRQGLQSDVEEILYRSLSQALRVRGDVSVVPGGR